MIMEKISKTGGPRYSHMVGQISKEEYDALGKDFKEAMKVFGRFRRRPDIISIEKWLGGRTVKSEDIYNSLTNYGSSNW